MASYFPSISSLDGYETQKLKICPSGFWPRGSKSSGERGIVPFNLWTDLMVLHFLNTR
jgi:hypothetical protein